MAVMTPIDQIQLQPGSVVSIPNINWNEFEEILLALGENRAARIAYSQTMLEIMVPLPEHERAIVVIGDLVKTILRIQRRPWESLRSSTFKRLNRAGVEPDDCFYIQNQQAVIGKARLNLSIDPPPDLAIECDLTSKTRTDAYLAIAVPELWIYDAGTLKIRVLQGDRYVDSSISPTFPTLPIVERVAKTVQRATQIGTSQALLEFEDWLNDSIKSSREE
jgi:Uma2 family endonuclease